MSNASEANLWEQALIPGAGVSLHLVTARPTPSVPDRAPLLFLHGFPEFWYAWKRQLQAFGGERVTAAPDMRGYGRSDKPREVDAYALPNLVADVAAILDRISPERPAVLVGHDWGGVVAWRFAMQHPERLEKLVIINAPHPAIFARELRNNPAQRRASAYVAVFRSPLAEPLLRAGRFALLRRAVFGGAARDAFSPADRRRYWVAWSQAGALTGGLNYYRAARFVPAEAMRPIRVPTLVLWAEKDTALLPGNLKGLEEHVADLTVRRLPNGTHWVVHEQSDVVNAHIEEFLGHNGR
jgi:pimeloyl-ACP methyl ester carboxylesterase